MKYLLAKHNAAVTPRKPKNGAEVGQVSIVTLMFVLLLCGKKSQVKLSKVFSVATIFWLEGDGGHLATEGGKVGGKASGKVRTSESRTKPLFEVRVHDDYDLQLDYDPN